MSDVGNGTSLGEGQDSDVNYYVIVPFTTAAAAEWAMGEIGMKFDCHVISAAAVDQNAPLVATLVNPEGE